MRNLLRILALLLIPNALCVFTKADLPPGTLEIITHNEEEELDLSGQTLSPENIIGIGGLLRTNTALKTISLANNYLDNSSIEAIISIMCANNTLVELDLSGNFIGEHRIKEAINATSGKWTHKSGNKFCLVRISMVKKLGRSLSLDNLDILLPPSGKKNNHSQRLSAKHQTRERNCARREKLNQKEL